MSTIIHLPFKEIREVVKMAFGLSVDGRKMQRVEFDRPAFTHSRR